MKNKIDKLPNAVDIEKSLFGAILIDSSVLDEVTALLEPNYFYDSNNRMLYKIILGMYDKGELIDTLTVYEKIKKKDLNDKITAAYISSLYSSSSKKAIHYAKILKEKWIYRQLILKSKEIIDLAVKESDDPFELLERAEENVSDIVMDMNKVQPNQTLWDKFSKFLDAIETKAKEDYEDGLTSSTFPSFNRMTGGMHKGDLTTIYGTSKAGKSSLALQICLDVALEKKPVAIFSLEMTEESIFNKSISMRADIDYRKLRSPKIFGLTPEEFQPFVKRALEKFKDTQIFVYDRIFDKIKIKAKIKELKHKHNIQLAVIDYLSLIEGTTKRERRDLEIADLSRYFKLLAKDLQIPILMLSQANENGATADGKALLRDSDACLLIEQPLENGISSVKLKDGSSFQFTKEHHLVTLKKSRHTPGGSQFVCKYVDNNFVEVDLYSQEHLFNEMEEVI